jgi:cell division protein FtsI/penicillin-binding protein 2
VVVNVEEGGFGSEAAAPAARYMLSEWYGIKKEFVQAMVAD